jgi:O-acetyl-ADP-ribose deacetylase (regulator of RNase III)
VPKVGHNFTMSVAKAAGPTLQLDSDAYIQQHGHLKEEEVALTPAGNLKCTHVLHCVAPEFDPKDVAGSRSKLAATVTACLELADLYCFTSIALPMIGTGAQGFPAAEAAAAMVRSVEVFLRTKPDSTLGQ